MLGMPPARRVSPGESYFGRWAAQHNRDLLLTVVDLADEAVIDVADDPGVRRPRPLVADRALVGSVTGCSAC